MHTATDKTAARLHSLKMAAEQAAIEAKQIRAAAEAAQNPSDREYGLRQSLQAGHRAAAAHVAWRNAQRKAVSQ
jgi:hypothetical protein